ncbi:zinc ribbon domain-containing protein [Mammaliicoccus sp. Dog046]|uniref:zinc ribbon domain-containing protein n=1 Tax=Mammaliicoccus sp. Dog046 TaxID=3034233 RepID=UPI002B259866|nr:zinc ribbon domain-containing protein [Mammaliicoccus sp. Dog046]WQK85395.1 zinc ribbon domain-containing protein [Mammaliicoccus sp. Dog046]
MNCPKCHAPITQDDRFCGECGEKLEQAEHSNNTESSGSQNEKVEKFKSSLNTYKNDTLNEGQGFFKNIFTRLDQEVSSYHAYSYKFIASLVGAGLLLLLIFSLIAVPKELEFFGVSKVSVVFKIIIFTILALGILFGVTFGVIKILMQNVRVQKVLSDFVSFNLFGTLSFFVGVLFALMSVPSFAIIFIAFSLLLFVISPIYLMTKYSNQYQLRMPVIYGIIIYFVVLGIIVRILVESTFTSNLLDIGESIFDSGY